MHLAQQSFWLPFVDMMTELSRLWGPPGCFLLIGSVYTLSPGRRSHCEGTSWLEQIAGTG